MDKSKTKSTKAPTAKAPARVVPPAPPAHVPPLFRKTDWLTLLITFGTVWVVYYLTLAPELTLEDSGELATGSYYAGIPHPPGYPFWTIYTWLWTVLLPVKNIAWRVALAEATGGALAAGLLGFLVSRGSSMLIEGIEDLKSMVGRWENAICMVSGFVAGGLIGFNGYMWSQSVIVEVYSFSVASLVIMLLCLLRWIYAPHQRRFLFYALFAFGICFTNHQTLIVAAMGIEVAIAAAHPRLGRDLFMGNSLVYFLGLIGKGMHMLPQLEQNPAVFIIFNVVGIASILACIALAVKTGELASEWKTVLLMGIAFVLGAAFYFFMPISGMTNPPMQWGYPRTVEGFVHAFTRGQYEKTNPSDIINDPMRFITQLGMLLTGVGDEFNWVYAGIAVVPFLFFFKMHQRERAWLIGITAIYLCLGVLLLILLNPPPDRAAQELVRVFFTASHTLVALLVGYGLTLIAAYMATHYQKFRIWGLIGGVVAAVLAVLSLFALTQETFFGKESKVSASTLVDFMKSCFTDPHQYGVPVFAGLVLVAMTIIFVAGLLAYRKRAPLAITLAMFALMPLYSALTHWSDNEQRGHWFGYWFGHDMFTPPFKGADGKLLYPEMTKDAVLYGGTDPGRFCPTYMIFCESFTPHDCQPKLDQKFDRRDVYIITQNALADSTYLCYLRAQYNRSKQIDPPFFQELVRPAREVQENYKTNLVARMLQPLDWLFGGLGASVEKDRRTATSRFTVKDFTDLPAFTAKLRPGQQQDALSKWLFQNFSKNTQDLVTGQGNDAAQRAALARDLNRLLERELEVKKTLTAKQAEKAGVDQEISDGSTSEKLRRRQEELGKAIAELGKIEPLYTTNHFQGIVLSPYVLMFIAQDPKGDTRIRLNRLLIEEAYPKMIAQSLGGLYPDREIYIPTPEDSQNCFQEYLKDAERRAQHDQQFPNEPRQIKPGEDVHIINEGGQQRVQVSGQVAVMTINGLLTKVIFDHCPDNEFFIEESFPLDWMYPYLEPYGVIMKINRRPLPELTEAMVKRDHEFWSQYSERLIGNWITYDTPVKEIVDFIERVYLRRNFKGFTGDRRFVRDDQAQKAFSKLRSSIGGVYNYRIGVSHSAAEQQRMMKEADFTFKQAFAFCPYSPEAVFRYVQLLANPAVNRLDDALLIAETCRKLDPYNASVIGLVQSLRAAKQQQASSQTPPMNLIQMEAEVRNNPSNLQTVFNLASAYLAMAQTNRATELLERVTTNSSANLMALPIVAQAYLSLGRTNRALELLEQVANHPDVNITALLSVAQTYGGLGNRARFESLLEQATRVAPNEPEVWYDLSATKASLGKPAEAIPALRRALELNAKRIAADPKARNLTNQALGDPQFNALRQTPEFQQLVLAK